MDQKTWIGIQKLKLDVENLVTALSEIHARLGVIEADKMSCSCSDKKSVEKSPRTPRGPSAKRMDALETRIKVVEQILAGRHED